MRGLFIVFVAVSTAHGSGFPTFDAAAVYQLVRQVTQLRQQYALLQQQYAALTGSYGRGRIGLDEALKSAAVVPGSWQDVVARQARGEYGRKLDAYERHLHSMPATGFADPTSQAATTHVLSSDAVRAAMAGGDALFGAVQGHLDTLKRLSQTIDTTVNTKDAQDLQNRIAAENGMLQSALAKLVALSTNLQANLLNVRNQGAAAAQRYFHHPP